MVNNFSISSLYEAPFNLCARAFFLRYPNPFAGHIVSVDVLSREITPDNKLRSTRLILKRGQLPKWLPKNLVEKAESWVVEESTVDPTNQRLNCKSYNIDHIKLMRLIEEAKFTGEKKNITHHDTNATVISNIGTSTSSWMDIGVQVMRSRIENYTIKRFQKGLHKQRAGYLHTLDNIGGGTAQYSSGSISTTKSLSYRIRNLFHLV